MRLNAGLDSLGKSLEQNLLGSLNRAPDARYHTSVEIDLFRGGND